MSPVTQSRLSRQKHEGLLNGSLQLWNRTEDGYDKLNESNLDSKHTNNKAMEHTDLRTPVRLAFANHMNRSVTGDGAPSSPE